MPRLLASAARARRSGSFSCCARRAPPSSVVRYAGVTGLALGLPLCDHEVAALTLQPFRIHGVDELGGLAEVRGRPFVGQLLGRVLAGAHPVLDRLVEVVARAGVGEVMRELGEVRLEVAAVDLLDRRTGAPVHEHAARRGDRAVQGVADQRVRERVAPGCRVDLLDHARANRGLQAVEQLVLGLRAQERQDVQLELAAEDRRGHEQAVRRGAEAADALGDDVLHALGHREPAARVRPRLGADRARLREVAQHLDDEERVAFGSLVDDPAQLRRRVVARENADELRHGRRVEGLERVTEHPALAPELGQHLCQRMLDVELGLPVGAEHQETGLARIASQVLQQQQGRLVGPMQVVEHEHHGPVLRGLAQQRAHGLEQPRARALRVAGQRLREVGDQLRELGHEPSQLAADQVHLSGQLARRTRVDVLSQRLDERLLCEQALLVAAPVEHDRSVLERALRELRRQARLADARLAVHEHDPPAAFAHLGVGGSPAPRGPTTRPTNVPSPAAVEGRGQREPRRLAGGCRAVEIQRRGLLEDRLLQLLERRARLEAQLARQELARARVDVQRVALALAAIQREHELPDERFAPRVGGHELPQLADELGVAVAQQVRRDARLERSQPLLLEPRDLGRRERLEGEIRERRAAREPQRFAQQRRRVLGLAAGKRALPVVEQPLEALGVELAGRHLEEISRRCRAEDVRPAERLAQPRHVDLDALDGARRRVLAPQRERQAIGAHRLVGVQQQHGEDRTGLDTSQGHRSVLAVDLHGPEYPKLHGVRRKLPPSRMLV